MCDKFFVISTALIAVLFLSACAGTAFDRSHREQSVLNVLANNCESGQYQLAFENPDTEQGWKLQKEYGCTTLLKEKGIKPLNSKIYTKEELLLEAKQNEFIHTIVM